MHKKKKEGRKSYPCAEIRPKIWPCEYRLITWDSLALSDDLTWAEKLCIHTLQETHIHTDMVAPSCSRPSRRSVVLQGPDDSAHSFLAEPSLCASHHSDKQDSKPAYLTKLTPLLYYLLFYMGPLNTLSFRLHALAPCHRYMTPEALNPSFMRSRFQTFHANAITHQTPYSQSLKHNKGGTSIPVIPKLTPQLL